MRTWAERLALGLLLAHLVLLCCGGRDYVKIRAFGPVYVTEVVLCATFVLSARSILAVPWDRLTNLVALVAMFGVTWAVVGGIGDTRGAGAKAFSFFVYSAFYFIVRGVADDDEARWRVMHAIAYATIGAALIGLVQTQTGSPLFDPAARFEVTTTGSTRWLGGEYAVYAVIGLCVPAMAAIQGRFGALSMVLVVCAGTELVLAQHRSGFIAAGAALVATTIVVGGSARGLVHLVAFFALALGVYVVGFGDGYLGETVARLGETTSMQDANIAWRLDAWSEVLDAIVAQPFGHGFSTWSFAFTVKDPLTGSHNGFLDLAYRIGVPGLVAFLALPVVLFGQTKRFVERTGAAVQLLPITVCAAVLALLVFASFNVVFESPQVSILFWVLLGLGGGTLYDRAI